MGVRSLRSHLALCAGYLYVRAQMQRRVYLVGFSLVALCVLFGVTLTLLARFGVQIRYSGLFWFPELFSHPVPVMLRPMVPMVLSVILYWGFVALVIRRLAIFVRERSFGVPSSFTRAPYVLVLFALGCVGLAIVGLAASIALKAGSGVPAGMLVIPAALLLSPVLAWIEFRSLFSKGRGVEP
jgi:hypothetical protein